jgi:hypothetical protein
MRSATIALLSLLLLPAAAAAPTRTVTTPAAVSALAFDAGRVAYASGRSANDCNRVQVWNLSTRGVTTFPRPTTCVQTSTGSGIADLAIAGTRVLWLHYIGGNTREWTLWTATTTKTKPLRLRFVSRDVDDAAPIVVGDGDSSAPGGVLPYAVDREVIALRTNGARRFAWTAPAPVTALSALGNELAVASEGGVVTVLDGGGNVVRTERYTSDLQAIELTGDALVAQRGRRLELRGAGGPRTWLLPARARLDDAQGTRAYYVTGGQIRELRLDAVNRQRQLALGSHVQVEGSRLATSIGRRVLLRQPLP